MASELDKLFVYVGAGDTSSFKASHVGDVSTSDTYYKKVTFLEDTGEIATRGKLFGSQNAEVSVDASYNSLTVSGTEYTLTVNNGELALKPYTPLKVTSVKLYNGTAQLSSTTDEYDVSTTKTLTRLEYTISGTNNVDKLAVSITANGTTTWAVGTSATALEDIEDMSNGATYEVSLDDPITITSATNTTAQSIVAKVYAQDTKQTSPVNNSATVSINHGFVYIVSNTQPTASNYTTISVRTVATSKPSSITLKAESTATYAWFAFPTSWGTPELTDKSTGLGMTMKQYDTTAGDWDFTSSYSNGQTYTVWRSGNPVYEDQVITIKWS